MVRVTKVFKRIDGGLNREPTYKEKQEKKRQDLERQKNKQARKEKAQKNKEKELNKKESKLKEKKKRIEQMEKNTQIDRAQLEKEKEALRNEQKEFENYKAQLETREIYREADQKFDEICKFLGEKWMMEYYDKDGVEINVSKVGPDTVEIKKYTPEGYSRYTFYREDGDYYLTTQFENEEPKTLYGLMPEQLFVSEDGVEWPITRFEARIKEAQNYVMEENDVLFWYDESSKVTLTPDQQRALDAEMEAKIAVEKYKKHREEAYLRSKGTLTPDQQRALDAENDASVSTSNVESESTPTVWWWESGEVGWWDEL